MLQITLLNITLKENYYYGTFKNVVYYYLNTK